MTAMPTHSATPSAAYANNHPSTPPLSALNYKNHLLQQRVQLLLFRKLDSLFDSGNPVFYALLENAYERALVAFESCFELSVHTIVCIGTAVVEIPDKIAVVETACAVETGHHSRHF